MKKEDSRLDNIVNKRLDFVGIGVGKAGTSWIFKCLTEHPDIHGPVGSVKKELNFFSRNYDLGYYWYHRKFEFGPWKNGEFSWTYFPDKNVPERMYQYHPEIKMLLSLRNPIERAFSEHRYKVMNGRLPKHLYKFEDALPQFPMYIEHGKYASHLEHFLEFFPKSSIHVVLVDDIAANPKTCLQKMYKFLEVDDTFSPSIQHKKENPSRIYRRPGLERFIRRCSDTLRAILGDPIAEAVKATKIQELLRQFNAVKSEERVVPPLTEDMHKRLQDIFAEEMDRLSVIIGRDLSNWR